LIQNTRVWESYRARPYLAEMAALAGGLIYLAQSWIFAHTQASLVDEGAYLFLGRLFIQGDYRPFQDFGFWTNQMPLSFLVPGFVQLLLGPGIRTGRYLAIVLGLLFLLGLWLTARRLGGRWWAAAAVLLVALNPALVKMYSLMNAQVLVACMLVWMLALTVGEGLRLWQVSLGAALAGAVVLTRINLFPVLPILLVYIFWQHGRRAGVWAILAGFGVILLGHALFWPGILRQWAAWLPESLVPFLAAWRPPQATPIWNPEGELLSRIYSFLLAFRFHFVALIGGLTALLLWPPRSRWKGEVNFKASVLLLSLLGVLFFAHAWASLGVNAQTYDALGRNYCIFCFPVYLSFFSFLGILVVAASASSWNWHLPAWRQVLVVLLVLVLAVGIGFSAFDPVGNVWLDWRVPRLRTLLRTGQLLPGYVPLWEYLQNNLNLKYAEARRLLPALGGAILGLCILGISTLFWKRGKLSGDSPNGRSIGALSLVGFLVAGLVLTPTVALGAGFRTYDCGGDVIAAYESVGSSLSTQIPAGSKVYWQGGLSAVPLLYVKSVQIYPPQVFDGYTFRLDGDPQELLRYGFWSQPLAERWLAEADFVLVQERFYEGWLKSQLSDLSQFQQVAATSPTLPCRDDASIRIFKPVH
jgi:hypothetical protein